MLRVYKLVSAEVLQQIVDHESQRGIKVIFDKLDAGQLFSVDKFALFLEARVEIDQLADFKANFLQDS